MDIRNRLLSVMPPEDSDAILNKSDFVALVAREKLEEPDRPPRYVYFIETGLASLKYRGRGDYVTDVALVGNEGCTGCGVILGVHRSPQAIAIDLAPAGVPDLS